MKNKASVLTLRIPAELKHKIERLADEQGVSINQLALYAFTKEVQEMETSAFFAKQYSGKNRNQIFEDFQSTMAKIKKSKSVPSWDKVPQ